MARIYLDHAATTPIAPAAQAAMAEAWACWANPSSPHREGRAARAALEGARERIKAALGWRDTLIFTGGATESAAIALGRSRRPVIASAVEHAAVRGARRDAVVAPIGIDGLVDPERLQDLVEHHPRALVAIQQVNSETGIVQPLDRLAAIVRAGGGQIFADCAQGAGKLPLPDADLVAVSAHKLGGPPGIGALLVRDLTALSPWGQGQETGYRPGTENLPAILGFAAALELASSSLDWMAERQAWRDRLDDAIRAGHGTIVGDGSPRSPLIASYAMPGMSAAAQLMRLDGLGFAVSAGSACSSGSMRPSPVLAAMGLDADVSSRTIRISLGRTTTAEDVDAFAIAWETLAREARSRAA